MSQAWGGGPGERGTVSVTSETRAQDPPPPPPRPWLLLALTWGPKVGRAAVDRRGLPQPARVAAGRGEWDPV